MLKTRLAEVFYHPLLVSLRKPFPPQTGHPHGICKGPQCSHSSSKVLEDEQRTLQNTLKHPKFQPWQLTAYTTKTSVGMCFRVTLSEHEQMVSYRCYEPRPLSLALTATCMIVQEFLVRERWYCRWIQRLIVSCFI